jgi:hypothetical protein
MDLVQSAERALDAAGFDLISVMAWRQGFENRELPISRWEQRLNELAHSLGAEHLYESRLAHDRLREYASVALAGHRHGQQ